MVGYVPAAALDPSWLEWMRELGARESRQILVPLGIPELPLEARQAGLERAVVGHACERWTGPVYPAPQVLALLQAADSEPDRAAAARSESGSGENRQALALWRQARRALPRLGERLGMQAPDPAISQLIPTAAFLAQRALLRVRTARTLIATHETEVADLAEADPDRVARADVVLEGAAEVLSDHESKVVLRGHGVEVTRQAFATSASGAATFADKIGYPVVLKALSPDLRRKRELGAVELDVANAAAAKRAYSQIVANVEEHAPTAQLDGVIVAEMAPAGRDLRCGALRTADGSVVIFAQAVLDAPTEAILAPSPLSARNALLLAEAALAAIPLPARRRASDPDVRVLAKLLATIDRLIRHTGERLLSVDLAPVRLLGAEVDRPYLTLDARIVQRPHLEGL